IRRIYSKIDSDRDNLVRVEEHFMDDAEIAVVSFGVASRPSMGAVLEARNNGIKVGLLRLIMIWPFPRKAITALGKNVKRIFVPEMNLGQVSREIERFVDCDVIPISKIGGVSHRVSEIYSVVKRHS
ncbi:MAG: 2-oxoacid:acceptor oxidoreductase subunit alpha, partial [bacterium]